MGRVAAMALGAACGAAAPMGFAMLYGGEPSAETAIVLAVLGALLGMTEGEG